MELTKNDKYMIVSELAPWYSPKEIHELTGLSPNAVYRLCHSYGIIGYRDNMTNIKREFEGERQAYIKERRLHQKQGIKEYLNGSNHEEG